MIQPPRKSFLCPNCRRIISADEPRCPHCGLRAPGSRWRNNPLGRGWGDGKQLVKLIISVNVAMFLLSLLLNPRMTGMGANPLKMLSPTTDSLAALGATGTLLMSRSHGWWTLLTANYLHGSALHIFFNMMALYQISPMLTQLYGTYRFFIIYTVSGLLGFILSFMAGIPLTIGASAALCGLIGAALFYGKNRGGVFGQTVYRQIGGWALSIIIFGFVFPGINNWAHIGGMAAGALTASMIGYHENRREHRIHSLIAWCCAGATALALAWGILRALIYWTSLVR